MTELLLQIPLPVLVIIGVLIVISFLMIAVSYLKGKSLDALRTDVYRLFLKAEHKFNESNTGKQKMKYVVSLARSLLPSWIQAFVSEQMLEEVIQVWFDEVKDLLDDGKVNGSQANKK